MVEVDDDYCFSLIVYVVFLISLMDKWCSFVKPLKF